MSTVEMIESFVGLSIGDKVKVNCNPAFYFYVNLNNEMKKWKDKPMTIKHIFLFELNDIIKLYTIRTKEICCHWPIEDVIEDRPI